MRKGILGIFLLVLLLFYCSKIKQYLSNQKQIVTITEFETPVMDITGATFDSGELIVFYNSMSDSFFTNRNFLYQRSNNNGISWSNPEKVFQSRLEVSSPFLAKLTDESLILVYNDVSETIDSRDNFYLVRSYDFGKTFTVPRMINIPGYKGVEVTGSIVHMGKSTLLIPFQAFNEEEKQLCLLFSSTNKGRTWKEVVKITPDSYRTQFTNPKLINVNKGKLYCLLEEENGYLYSTCSYDTGKTWTKPECTNIYGRTASLLLSDDGSLICCYEDETPQGISMMKSFDLGMTWENEIHLIEGSNVILNPYLFLINSSNAVVLYAQRNFVTNKSKTKWQLQCRFIEIKKIKKPRAVAASIDDKAVHLRWNKVDNASYYIIYRSSLADLECGPDNIIAKTGMNNYIDNSIEKEGKYYYSISAVDGYGRLISGTGNESELSEPILIELKLGN